MVGTLTLPFAFVVWLFIETVGYQLSSQLSGQQHKIQASQRQEEQCVGIVKENKDHVSQAMTSFSTVITTLAGETIDSMASARVMVKKVRPSMVTMVTALQLSRNETQRAEQMTRNETLKTNMEISKLKRKTSQIEENLMQLKLKLNSDQRSLDYFEKELSKYQKEKRFIHCLIISIYLFCGYTTFLVYMNTNTRCQHLTYVLAKIIIDYLILSASSLFVGWYEFLSSLGYLGWVILEKEVMVNYSMRSKPYSRSRLWAFVFIFQMYVSGN